MEKQKTIFKDKDGYFIEQGGNRIYVKPVDSKEKDESKWTFTDGANTYTPSQLQEKRAEYSSAYDPYALTDLLDWTAENTIGLPIKLAAQTETGQKSIPYVGKVLSVAQPSKWYGTITGKGAPWSEKNTGFGDSKHDKSLNTLVDWALSPALVKGEGAIAKAVGKEATMQLASKVWSPAVKYVLGKPTIEQPALSAITYSPTSVIRSETYLKPLRSSWTTGNKAKANIATKYYWSNKPDSFFELVKDVEPESYSVHFKTPLSSITHGEKMGLFAKVADEVPEGSTISTYGYLTKGDVHGVKRFGTDFEFRQVGSRNVHMKDGTQIEIPILKKPTLIEKGITRVQDWLNSEHFYNRALKYMDKKDAIKLGDIESKFMDPDYSSDNILKFKIKKENYGEDGVGYSLTLPKENGNLERQLAVNVESPSRMYTTSHEGIHLSNLLYNPVLNQTNTRKYFPEELQELFDKQMLVAKRIADQLEVDPWKFKETTRNHSIKTGIPIKDAEEQAINYITYLKDPQEVRANGINGAIYQKENNTIKVPDFVNQGELFFTDESLQNLYKNIFSISAPSLIYLNNNK